MLEFGSDYHYIKCGESNGNVFLNYFNSEVRFYANGRCAIVDLILNNPSWKRIWIPNYFCYDVINAISLTGIQVVLYDDSPLVENVNIKKLPFLDNDVLLRMNFFGLREFRTNHLIRIPVIEDHSHDLIGDWAIHSDADWCFASLRKTIPIPEGGALWSPKGHVLPSFKKSTLQNDNLTNLRWQAMYQKKLYLQGNKIDKNTFRTNYIKTEDEFLKFESVSGISKSCIDYLQKFDLQTWYEQKQINWDTLSNTINEVDFNILNPQNFNKCNIFSLLFVFSSTERLNIFKTILLSLNIYPAILWKIPLDTSLASSAAGKLLSVHCDARYSNKINKLVKRVLLAINLYIDDKNNFDRAKI